LENRKLLGDGRFGKLERATWASTDGNSKKVEQESVIIKKYKRPTTKSDVLDERDRISAWNHPNVSRLIGVVQSGRPGAVPSLILEYPLLGDLRSYLLNTRRSGGVNALRMSKLAHGIASGMDYLHSKDVIHGDLSCRNIALDDKLNPKINDWGFYKERENARFYMHYNQPNFPCPVRWMSPENLPYKLNRQGKMVESNSVLSKDGDIWSYGVVLFEIWSRGETPFEGFDHLAVCEMLLNFRKPTHFHPLSMRDHVRQTMMSCWRMAPHRRPLFSIIKKHLAKHENLSDSNSKTNGGNGQAKGKGRRHKKNTTKKDGETDVKDEEGKKTEGGDEQQQQQDKKEEQGEKAPGENQEKVVEDGTTKVEGTQETVVKKTDDPGYSSDNHLIECS